MYLKLATGFNSMADFRRVNRNMRDKPFTLTAPIGGLNGREGQANMPAEDAYQLDNFFPGTTTVDVRKGTTIFATAPASAAVNSLEVFRGAVSEKLLCAVNGAVYDISGGAFGAALVSGLTSTVLTSCMFSNAGSQYLICLTGADQPFAYDGAAYTALTITGLTGSQNNLHCVFAFKERIYLAQKDQLGFYYLAVGAIQGAASYFDLSQIADRGGYLAGISSFSQDAGNGPQDFIVFMTSQGEYIVYSGYDPSTVANWSLVGRYYAGAPIGRKGWFKFADDLYVMTTEGILPFKVIMSRGNIDENEKALTAKLGSFYTDLTEYSTQHGWSAVVYPRSNMLVVNVPDSTVSTTKQFVLNTVNYKWCRFTGLNGLSFAVYNNRLYFGNSVGQVFLADEGYSDNGSPIVCTCRQAYNYFDNGYGMGDRNKLFQFATIVIGTDGAPTVNFGMNTNFEEVTYEEITDYGDPAYWDYAVWDDSYWGDGVITRSLTAPIGMFGYVASVYLQVTVDNEYFKWYATRIAAEAAEGLSII